MTGHLISWTLDSLAKISFDWRGGGGGGGGGGRDDDDNVRGMQVKEYV